MKVIEPFVNLGPLEASGAAGCVADPLLAILAVFFIQLGHVLGLWFSFGLPRKLVWIGLADCLDRDPGHLARSLRPAASSLGAGFRRRATLGS